MQSLVGQPLTLAPPGTMLGTKVGLEIELTSTGFRFVLAVLDPRDPLKRAHRFEFDLPTADGAKKKPEGGA